MRRASAVLLSLTILMFSNVGTAAAQERLAVGGEGARQELINGNKRFVETKHLHPNQTAQRRSEVAKGQHPFAAIVSCSDSRVPPEIIFDRGLGDLFIIRLAGNIVDDAALGSLEYAVKHLGVQYIMVLGHDRCGAVEAAVKGGEVPGHIGSLVKAIQPAVDKVKNQPGDVLDNAVKSNVAMVVQQLKSSEPILEDYFKKGALTVDGARYNLDKGQVELIP